VSLDEGDTLVAVAHIVREDEEGEASVPSEQPAAEAHNDVTTDAPAPQDEQDTPPTA